MIYCDYAATTPVDPKVILKMQECLGLEGVFGNASSGHRFGFLAREKIEQARAQVAFLIGAKPKEVVFTSGATEANNLALKGVALAYQDQGRHIITSKAEHKAVLATCEYLETLGFSVTYLATDGNGLVSVADLQAALRPETVLVSLMHINNELGTAHDLQALGEIVKAHGALFHVDGAQSLGKISLNLKKLPVDLMSFSAHKCYGPKGAGALFVRKTSPKLKLVPQLHGGSHEFGIRSGTSATHQLVGFGEACALLYQNFAADVAHLQQCHDQLWQGLSSCDVTLNGEQAPNRAPHILSVTFNDVDGAVLTSTLAASIAFSQGSACNTEKVEASHVLQAIGLSAEQAGATIRFSVGRFTTAEEIAQVIKIISEALRRLNSAT